MKRALRAAIYARYSTDEQRPESIADQIESCKRYIEARGWSLAGIYTDAAMSGSSDRRPDFERLRQDAERRQFDVVVSEALDRISRRLADVATIHDRLTFLGIHLHTVDRGEISALLAGVLGAVAQGFLDDLKHKTRRGMRGKALAGLSAGGLTYGYKAVADKLGERVIDPDEAAVVVRIFKEFASGRSPREIAKNLNADGIAPPRHTKSKGASDWGDTTIRGQTKRGTGILNNRLYVGELVWDRCSYVKDPSTGKRQARPKPESEWEVVSVPELRILPDDLWQAVKVRQSELEHNMQVAGDNVGSKLASNNRKRHLLSGLMKCGSCGSPFILVGKNYYGCNRHRSKGTCSNQLTVRLQDIEERVISALRDRLLSPEILEDAVKRAREAIARDQATADDEVGKLQRKLVVLEGQIGNIVDAIAGGMNSPALRAKLQALEGDAEKIKGDMLNASAPPPELPEAAAIAMAYQMYVENLLVICDPDEYPAGAFDLVRQAISEIVLTPTDEGLRAEMRGSFTGILKQVLENKQPASEEAGCSTALVAGARFELTAFRL